MYLIFMGIIIKGFLGIHTKSQEYNLQEGATQES